MMLAWRKHRRRTPARQPVILTVLGSVEAPRDDAVQPRGRHRAARAGEVKPRGCRHHAIMRSRRTTANRASRRSES
jgi:hypothetical protein